MFEVNNKDCRSTSLTSFCVFVVNFEGIPLLFFRYFFDALCGNYQLLIILEIFFPIKRKQGGEQLS